MRNWFTVKAQAGAPAEISILDDIGAWGVTAKQFIDELRALQGDTINLSINSLGGSVFDGLAIHNALRHSGKTVNVKVLGVAASIASVIAMAGDKIEMPENSFMMIHNPWTFAMGDSGDLRDMADVLDKIAGSLIGTYVARTGKSEDEVKALLDAETWMTAAEAKDLGFADEVTPAFAAQAAFDLDRLPANVRAAFNEAPRSTPAAGPTFAARVQALAAAAGLGEHADKFILDASLQDVEAAGAAIEQAREVVALCAFAKVDAAEHLRKPLAQVRQELCDARAAADEALHVDTAPKSATSHSKPDLAAVTTAGIWTAIRNR